MIRFHSRLCVVSCGQRTRANANRQAISKSIPRFRARVKWTRI
jgi:hypothetical protein